MNTSHSSPHVTVATVVYQDGRYLLVEEKADAAVVFNQPAGHWEYGETLLDSAVREALEETGHHVTLTGFLGLSQLATTKNGVYFRTTFVAEQATIVPEAKLDKDIIAAHWLTYDEILNKAGQLRSPLVLNDIERHRSGKIYPLELIFTSEIL